MGLKKFNSMSSPSFDGALLKYGMIGGLGVMFVAGAISGQERQKDKGDIIDRCAKQIQRSRGSSFVDFVKKVESTILNGYPKGEDGEDVFCDKDGNPKPKASKEPKKISYQDIENVVEREMAQYLRSRPLPANKLRAAMCKAEWALVLACRAGVMFDNIWGDVTDRTLIPGWAVWRMLDDFWFKIASQQGPGGGPLLQDMRMTAKQSADIESVASEIEIFAKGLYDDYSEKDNPYRVLISLPILDVPFLRVLQEKKHPGGLCTKTSADRLALISEPIQEYMAHIFKDVRHLCVKNTGEGALKRMKTLEKTFIDKFLNTQSEPETLKDLESVSNMISALKEGDLKGAAEIKQTNPKFNQTDEILKVLGFSL